MARPAPDVLFTAQEDDSELDILDSPGYWCIGLQGQPVSLRRRIWTNQGEIMKYPRTGFNNRAHCERLADRLNLLYGTDQFSCLTLIEPIKEWAL